MAESTDNKDAIKDTDIVFDCPFCGKSLAIDYRGAGLIIPCSDCGKDVDVPIPEGMELTDIDSTDEEQELRILNLRRSLSTAEKKVAQLESEVEELRQRREVLEKYRTDSIFRIGQVAEHIDIIHGAMQTVNRSTQIIMDAIKDSKV